MRWPCLSSQTLRALEEGEGRQSISQPGGSIIRQYDENAWGSRSRALGRRSDYFYLVLDPRLIDHFPKKKRACHLAPSRIFLSFRVLLTKSKGARTLAHFIDVAERATSLSSWWQDNDSRIQNVKTSAGKLGWPLCVSVSVVRSAGPAAPWHSLSPLATSLEWIHFMEKTRNLWIQEEVQPWCSCNAHYDSKSWLPLKKCSFWRVFQTALTHRSNSHFLALNQGHTWREVGIIHVLFKFWKCKSRRQRRPRVWKNTQSKVISLDRLAGVTDSCGMNPSVLLALQIEELKCQGQRRWRLTRQQTRKVFHSWRS